MSWYATRDLGFLPSAYPVQLGSGPPEIQAATVQYDHRSNITASGNHRQVTAEDIIREFPSVFDSEPTPREAVADIAASQAKYFTTLDALSGYHQCPLAPECQNLTTFITPFGRFKFLRAPFGICSISEHYNRRMDEALTGISQVRKIVDDCLVYDADFDAHVNQVRQVLQRCAAKGISLKRDKFVFAVNPDITKAIRDFPKPTNVTDLRSFFGLANQLANFTSDIAAKLEPLRPLLKKNREFCWDDVQDEAFLAAKEALATSPVLSYYDPRKEMALAVDASRLHGLGFVLQQRQTDGEWRMVQAGSRFLSETETRYAMIELELLGISWAVRKCRMFLDGLPHFEIITDHRPLITILNKHSLNEIANLRLQRLRMHLSNYKFAATWRSGKEHVVADALSRAPTSDPSPDDEMAEQEVETHLRTLSSAVHGSVDVDVRLAQLRSTGRKDGEYQELTNIVEKGFLQEKTHPSVLLGKTASPSMMDCSSVDVA